MFFSEKFILKKASKHGGRQGCHLALIRKRKEDRSGALMPKVLRGDGKHKQKTSQDFWRHSRVSETHSFLKPCGGLGVFKSAQRFFLHREGNGRTEGPIMAMSLLMTG